MREFVEGPQEIKDDLPDSPPIHAESSDLVETDSIQELLVDQLRDILARGKAAPQSAAEDGESRPIGATSAPLRDPPGRDGSPGRAPERMLRHPGDGRRQARKGMMGLVEEGEEVIAESKKKDDAAADLALIGAAQRVEHYEMVGYSTARNLAQQLHHSAIAQHLSRSLAEGRERRSAPQPVAGR